MNTFSTQIEQTAALVDQDVIAYIDYALARQLTKPFAANTDHSVLFLCYLSAAARHGHLCIVVQDMHLKPDVQELWYHKNLSADFYEQLKQKILLGYQELPQQLMTILSSSETTPAAVQTPLCQVDNRIYLQRFWLYETLFWQHYKTFVSHTPHIQLDKEAFLATLEKMTASKALLPAQALALQNALEQPLTIISGGPGTGKSYTAGQLVRIFWGSLSTEQQQACRIVLAAPTGKAAANLQKSLLKACGDLATLPKVPAVTLHRLLGIHTQETSLQAHTHLTEDVLIVDESSMVDIRLMAQLFAAIKPGARLILLGDKHQLPAIDAGAPFADLIAMQSVSASSCVTELDVCLRAELQEIVSFATAVNQGHSSEVWHFFQQKGPLEHMHLADTSLTDEYLCRLSESTMPYYRFNAKLLATPERLFEQSNRFRILSPLKKGPLGVEHINAFIHQQQQKDCTPGQTFISPIIVLKNDYRLEVFNGEVGLLVQPNFTYKHSELSYGDFALLPTKDGTIRSIPALLLPAFEYAYCLSVHKSQGSEFDHVLLLMPPGSEIFGREVLYTAVTRARRKLELWSSKSTLEATIHRKSYRLSRVCTH